MKFSKKFISLFLISLSFACNYKYDGDNPVINDVKNTKRIGKMLIANKNSNFLSLNFKFNLIFLTNNLHNIKNGIIIPSCFNKKINGNLK